MRAYLEMIALTALATVAKAAQAALMGIGKRAAKAHNRIEALYPRMNERFDAAERRFHQWRDQR